MSNMSYCRFQNTSNDLSDCLDAMNEMQNNDGRDEYDDILGEAELSSMESLISTAQEIVDMADDVLGLIKEAKELDAR